MHFPCSSFTWSPCTLSYWTKCSPLYFQSLTCKSLWIKASAVWVDVNVKTTNRAQITLKYNSVGSTTGLFKVDDIHTAVVGVFTEAHSQLSGLCTGFLYVLDIDFKTSLMVYRAVNGLGQKCMSDQLLLCYDLFSIYAPHTANSQVF